MWWANTLHGEISLMPGVVASVALRQAYTSGGAAPLPGAACAISSSRSPQRSLIAVCGDHLSYGMVEPESARRRRCTAYGN